MVLDQIQDPPKGARDQKPSVHGVWRKRVKHKWRGKKTAHKVHLNARMREQSQLCSL